MKKKFIFILTIFICLTFFKQTLQAVECLTPIKGGTLPEISLPVPQNTSEKDYLGIEEKDSFNVSQIKSDVVIIEIFSMYCPYCQKEAPMINKLYQIINDRPDLRDKIKIIGIGTGNTPFEINVFKNQYNIPFPLFPDESFSVHKSVGEVRTPYFFVIKKNEDGFHNILYSKGGTIENPEQFLDLIIKEAGLK